MKAVAYHRYGGPEVLQIEDVEKPVPQEDEVLVKIRAASVSPSDRHCVRGKPYFLRLLIGLRKPKIARLGSDVSGEVEAVGRKVTQFKMGDEVFGLCRGSFAEYACAPESALALKPKGLTFEQAASAPHAALTALQGLRKGRLQPGQKVLINGAAGGVGTFAVQIAKAVGAEVTGVCSTRNVEMVHSIAADRVIDYTQEDFTKRAERYDLILDSVGNHSLLGCRRLLNARGIYVVNGAPESHVLGGLARGIRALILSRFISQDFLMFLMKITNLT
jgi:NADPH:quinone reductase-like Zn-dependent oxidoreductase